MAHPRLTVVFVHGLLSSVDAWSGFVDLLGGDPDFAGVELRLFGYASPAVSLRPDRQIPRFDEIAGSLWTFLTHDLADRDRLVLVTHSQGGLVAQRMLARTLADGCGEQLHRIRRLVMFACPNSGSEIALLVRRWFSRHPQERELRPLHDAVIQTQRRVLNQIVHADRVGPDRCPIRVVAYAAESDRVVRPGVATGVFPETGVLPGDHFTVIRPDSHMHRSYTALAAQLSDVLAGDPPAPATDDAAAAHPPKATDHLAGGGVAGRRDRIVDRLLAVPGMRQVGFRDRLYAQLPAVVQDQLPRHDGARIEMFALVETVDSYRHLGAWDALTQAVAGQVPDHPAVAELRGLLVELGLVTGDPGAA